MARQRVLVVEDDRDIREMVAELLVEEGYEVTLAGNGLEGLSQAQRHRPNVIVLDLMMPVMNGWEFRQAQKLDPTIVDVPVVILSAVARGRATLDADAFVPKPFDVETLLSAVERLAPTAC